MTEVDPLVPGNCCIPELPEVPLRIPHVQVDAVPGGRKEDILVRADHPFLGGGVVLVVGPLLEGSCCSLEGSRGLGNHLENYQ